jgi:hypothetical protein
MLPISSDEDRYVPSCVRVPARSLPHLSGTSLAFLLALASAITFTSRQETSSGPPSAQAPHPS